jgi:Mn2+/Fe2+ NRAMP family transporter
MFSREKQTGHFATPRETAIDFYIGYFAAVVMAVLFVALGALVMYGSGERFDGSGIAFSNQLVNLYAANIGDWSRPLILTAAFITMFSTTLTCVDGYPRSLAACCRLLSDCSVTVFQRIHRVMILFSAIIAMIIVLFFVQNLIQLLTFAAVISFLTSPVLAWINLRVMNGANVPPAQRPGRILSWVSWLGLGYFVIMIGAYLIYHLVAG